MPFIFRGLGRHGRLGNQLWQIAAGIGVAESCGETVRFPHWEYAPYFNVPPEYFVDPDQLSGTEVHRQLHHMRESQRLWMQDYRLIAPVEARIRTYFTPSERALRELPTPVWQASTSPTLALHVRRGDLVNQRRFAPIVAPTYYQEATALYPDDIIVVFSDDIEWCRDNLPALLPGRQLMFQEATPRKSAEEEGAHRTCSMTDWMDLVLMTRCDHHVISNSSFAWWGAFLSANRSPVYPSNWFGPVPVLPDARMLIPPGWREVQNRTKDLDPRSRSNAYLFAFDRLPWREPAKWFVGPVRLLQSLAADPLNTVDFVVTKFSFVWRRLVARFDAAVKGRR